MIFCLQAFDDHIIYMNFYRPAYLIFENYIYQPFVSSSDNLQAERHNLVAIYASNSYEGYFGLIFFAQWYLVMSYKYIHKAV